VKVEEINQILLRNPTIINVTPKENNLENISQLAYSISNEKKGPLLRHLIKSGNLKQVLVFTASTYKADNVSDKLRKNGIAARAIHGKKNQEARKMALQDFKNGRLRVLVTTDLLARGIDIEYLPHVINYELPRSPKDYIHRIGRTGRAESLGEAITFVAPEDEHHFKIIQKKMKISVERIESNGVNFN
jgi:ATP-dependent RNA helicase RhlE